MELEVTWNRIVRVWWSFFWRSIIVLVLAFIGASVVGFIIGFTMRLLGFPLMAVHFITAPVGFMIGLGASLVPWKLILGKDLGEFRLVLLAKQASVAVPTATPQVTP